MEINDIKEPDPFTDGFQIHILLENVCPIWNWILASHLLIKQSIVCNLLHSINHLLFYYWNNTSSQKQSNNVNFQFAVTKTCSPLLKRKYAFRRWEFTSSSLCRKKKCSPFSTQWRVRRDNLYNFNNKACFKKTNKQTSNKARMKGVHSCSWKITSAFWNWMSDDFNK